MNCEQVREELAACLYEEAEPTRKRTIAEHLETCPSCQEAWAELQQTTRLLSAWKDEEPPSTLVFVPQRRKRFWSERRWSIGMGLAAALVVLALGHSQLEYGQGRMRLQWSLGEAPDSLEAPLTRAEFLLAQQQSQDLLQQVIAADRIQQRHELEQVLAQFAAHLDQQRQEDLKLVAQGLEAMDWSTADRLSRTEGLLQQLLVAAAGY